MRPLERPNEMDGGENQHRRARKWRENVLYKNIGIKKIRIIFYLAVKQMLASEALSIRCEKLISQTPAQQPLDIIEF